MDANVSPAVLKALVQHCNTNNIPSECVMSYGFKAITDVSFMCHSIFVSLWWCFDSEVFFDALQRAHFRIQVRLNSARHLFGPRIRLRRLPNQICLSKPPGVGGIGQVFTCGSPGTDDARPLAENSRRILDRIRIFLVDR
jgi:hypothetical protein